MLCVDLFVGQSIFDQSSGYQIRLKATIWSRIDTGKLCHMVSLDQNAMPK